MKIAIKSCMKDWMAGRHAAIRGSWGTHPDIEFFYGNGAGWMLAPSRDEIFLNVPDDYDSLPIKTKAICHACRNEDFAFLCDTDTYVSIPRLLASGFEQYDYSGHVLNSLPVPPYCSGPHYWLSKKALNILADADWSQYQAAGHETCEDVMVGTILAAHGITPHHDPRYALFESPTPENDVIANHLSCRGGFRIEMMYEAHRKANVRVRPAEGMHW